MLTMQGGDSLVGGLPIIHITYQQYIANPSAYEDPDVIVHISGFPTAGNMPADYVGYDSNLNMEDIGNIATKAIAKVEPSDTALYLHEVGTGFINKDGNYCITDVQIAVGGSIVLGTNCHVVDGGISSNLSNLINGELCGSVTGTGNETNVQLLNALFAMVDMTKISKHSYFVNDYAGKKVILPIMSIESAAIDFSRVAAFNNSIVTDTVHLSSASTWYTDYYDTSIHYVNQSTITSNAGRKFSLYYK